MGARNAYQKKQKKGNKLSRDYVKGLNFILSDQADKAVDHFIALLEVDSDTIETHLALGNLFRQRGEVERAIRIHQNLIARPTLTLEQRDLALLQLGKDFYQSGLFDRSVEIFIQLKDSVEYQKVALEQLLNIYQQLKEWNNAIAVTEELSKLSKGKEKQRTLAYLYCTLAIQDNCSSKQKLKLLKKALSIYPNCIQASIELADFYHKENDTVKAIELLKKVPDLDIEFTEIILDKLMQWHKELGTEEELIQYLYPITNLGGGASSVIMLSKLISKYKSLENAKSFVLQELEKNPTMKGFNHLLADHLDYADPKSTKESLVFLNRIVSQQIEKNPQYRCIKCGYSTKKHFWLCPSCKSWERIKPIKGIDGE
jgi:lipopolysaccharide biosynthesis regulator YciM